MPIPCPPMTDRPCRYISRPLCICTPLSVSLSAQEASIMTWLQLQCSARWSVSCSCSHHLPYRIYLKAVPGCKTGTPCMRRGCHGHKHIAVVKLTGRWMCSGPGLSVRGWA